MTRAALALALLAACNRAPQWPAERPAEACRGGAIQPGEQVLRVEVGGKTRQALVWMPPVDGPYTVVVNLHSFRSEPRRLNHYTRWVPVSEREPVIVVGPDGKTATWNAGECCGKAADRDYDDVAFLDAVVAAIEASTCTSGDVIAVGLGNGAMMAHRWACESDVPDAVISAGGTLQGPECLRERPAPVLHFHGTADAFAPADGSGGHRPVEHGLSLWRAVNRADGDQRVEADGDLSCTTWSGAAPVTSCTVQGGFHGWPGAEDMPVASTLPLADATTGGLAWVRAALAAQRPALP